MEKATNKLTNKESKKKHKQRNRNKQDWLRPFLMVMHGHVILFIIDE